LLEHFDRSPVVVQKAWPQIPGIEKTGKVEDTRWKEFRETWVKPAMTYWRRKRYRFVIEFVRRAVAVYEKLKRAGGGLDFQDLLISVTNGLRNHVELRSYFKMRFPYLLVDEFQDTDPVQAEMMLLLTSRDVKQSNWIRCSPIPGSLFLVGDPKQSIYRFRRGDIVTYNRVKEILQSSGGEVLPLVRNFRSRERLIDWNNQVYRDKFREANAYSPQCEDMLHGRVDSRSPDTCAKTVDGVYRLCLPDSHSDKIDEITETEADSVARFIRHAIDSRMQIHRTPKELDRGLSSEVRASDFMIIPFGKNRLDLFIQALEEYGIPYQVSGGNSLSNNQQLRWLIDCVKAIDDPLNPLPYLSLLRELFGFSDAELFEFHQAQGRFNPTSDIPSELEIQLSARFQKIVSQFRQYRLWMRTLPYAVALNCIAEDLGLLASAAAHAEGNNHSGGFLKAIEWLRHQSWDFDSASDLIQCLHDICEADDIDGCTALSPDSNVVRIMNLHKAKGLEAPIVFLVDTSRRYYGDVRCHIDRLAERPAGYMGITVPKGQYQTLEVAAPDRWNDLQKEEQRYLDAEFNRLLYVATTRAAQAMIVSFGKDDSRWSSLHGYLQSAPQLEIPDAATAKFQSGSRGRLLKQELAELASGTRWTQALVPSYEVITAKKLGLKGSARPKREATSGDYGYQWGSALHELLEICHKRPKQDLNPIAFQLLSQFGLDSNRLDELVATAQVVVGSEIWQRAQRSSHCFSELPIEIYEPKTEPSALPTRLVRGVIDLIFQEPDGWVIVDYKTDDITESELAATIQQYSGQLAEYARIWNSTTRQPVKSVGLFFTRLNRLAEFAPEA
jgi:ATP-dependent helicase/nuclease subunit A